MKWGMPTLVELPDMEANARLCKRLGLDFVEINMNLPGFQHDMLEAAAETAGKSGVGVTVHLDENFAPADFNPLVADAHMQTLLHTLRAAKRIGAPVVNMHLNRGVYFTLPERKVFLFDRYRDVFLHRIAELRELCESEIGDADLCVCIENTGGYLDFQRKAIDLLLESDVFALTWDIGHWHKGKIDDGPFLMERQGRLRHFHIHDADRAGDHLALGDGEIELERMISLADGCGARCVVETKTVSALMKSIGWLRTRGWL